MARQHRLHADRQRPDLPVGDERIAGRWLQPGVLQRERTVQDREPDLVRVGLQRHAARRHHAVELGRCTTTTTRTSRRSVPVRRRSTRRIRRPACSRYRRPMIIGWDTDLDWLITDNITLGANFSYTHSEYTDNFDGQRSERSEPAAVVVRPAEHPDRSRRQADAAGTGDEGRCRMRSTRGRWPTTARSRSWRTGAGSTRCTSRRSNPRKTLRRTYQRTDLRATWISPSTAWTVAAFADNVFDEIGLRQVDHYGSNEDVNFRRSGSNTIPQQLGISVDYKFGALK